MFYRRYMPPLPGNVTLPVFLVSDITGVGATRVESRVLAALGKQKAGISFDPCESIEYGGLLFLLPFLLANGLLSYKQYYS